MKMRLSTPLSALVAIATCSTGSLALAQDNQNMPPPETRTGAPIDQPSPTPDPTSAGAATMPSGRAPGANSAATETGTDSDASPGPSSDDDAANSADSSDTATAAPGGTTGANIDQATIEKFADAYVAVQSIQHKVASDLQKTSDPAEADKVKSSAQTDMIAAVERSGLQIDEFNQIAQSMAADNNIRSRVAAEVQKRTPTSSTPSTDPTNSGGG
jgi:Domain of unknown function (DUF4168)